MPCEVYIPKKFQAGSLAIIKTANTIIAEYRRQGFTLTLRQLYYQFVARDLIPNKQSEYKRLGAIINDGRLAGLIDWEAIEDRTRNVRSSASWEGPEEIMRAVADQFCLDLWEGQQYRPEVEAELVGVIEPVCRRYRVPYFACRGYTSQSEQWRAGTRFAHMLQRGLQPVVFHLGDHDPSGIDMTRDNSERLSMFAGELVEVRRQLRARTLRVHQAPERLRQYVQPGPRHDSRGMDDTPAEKGYVKAWMDEHGHTHVRITKAGQEALKEYDSNGQAH